MIPNEEQWQAIQRLRGPLYISAGAGTGKTGTITMRIAYAYSNDSNNYLTAYDQFLAATFTKAAAAELKIRVQDELRHMGCIEVAQSIDGAWISTLHALCARILRNEALAADINPFFTVIDSAMQASLMQKAFEEVIQEMTESQRAELLRIFGSDKEKLFKCLIELNIEISNVSSGYETLIQREMMSMPVSQVINHLKELSQTSMLRYGAVGGKRALKNIENIKQFLTELDSLELFSRGDESEDSFRLLKSMVSREFASRSGSEEDKDLYDQEQQAFYALAAEMVLRQNHSAKLLFINTACSLGERYKLKKTTQGALDESDLLYKTLQLFEEHQNIAKRYQEQFKLIMVDEFQDTDSVQLAIINHLTGPGRETLCTVGDEQQSIYGFRGADLKVYRAHKREMEKKGALTVKLDKNYRSHATIIEMSNIVFGKAFGSFSLPLCAARVENHRDQLYGPERLVVCLQQGQLGNSRKQYRVSEARAIAQEFARLRDQGVSPHEMVLLLRGTSNASLYVAAFQEQHLDSFVMKDSNFYHTPEVQIIIALIETLAFEGNDERLVQVLKSPLFRLDDYELFQVGKTKRDCWHQLQKCAQEQKGEGCIVAEKILRDALNRRGIDPLSIILKDIVESTAYDIVLLNKGAQGRAEYANVIKLISLVAEQEAKGRTDINELALYFCFNRDDNQKEAPGVFLSSQNEAVRIMTIHASKGLEFPVVAIGGFVEKYVKHEGSFVMGVHEGEMILSQSLSKQMLADNLGLEKAKGIEPVLRVMNGAPAHKSSSYDSIPPYCSLLAREVSLRYEKQREAFEEEQRLFYVACTRAQETLIVGATYNFTNNDTDEVGTQIGLIQDLARGLFEGRIPMETRDFTIGKFSGQVLVSTCTPDDPTEIVSEAQSVCPDAKRFIPFDEHPKHYSISSPYTWRSYSSLAHEAPRIDEDLPLCGEEGDAEVWLFLADEVRPTILGEAVHQACELMIHESSFAHPPSEKALEALMSRNGLNEKEKIRFGQAVTHIISSPMGRCIEAALQDDCLYVGAEVPFLLDLFENKSIYLEGYIDLLIHAVDKLGIWRIIDYKTGGIQLDATTIQESEAILAERHNLQARTYAYACFVAGAEQVEATFVYPERVRSDGSLLSHTFVFFKEDEKELLAELQQLSLTHR
jgi:ATP-dependent helicase/nuclease subunit A